jgi:hypothetical protein
MIKRKLLIDPVSFTPKYYGRNKALNYDSKNSSIYLDIPSGFSGHDNRSGEATNGYFTAISSECSAGDY